MDKTEQKLQQRLQQDAAAINAEVPAELRARIDAGLVPETRQASAPAKRIPLLWMTLGAAASLALLALVLVPRFDEPAGPETQFAATPEFTPQQASPLPLRVQTVELTAPLTQELKSLRVDLEKVRESIEKELRTTL